MMTSSANWPFATRHDRHLLARFAVAEAMIDVAMMIATSRAARPLGAISGWFALRVGHQVVSSGIFGVGRRHLGD
jgi:hypothetical protein